MRARKDPGGLVAEEEEPGIAAVDDRVIGVISVDHAIVTIPEEEEADIALGSVALSCTLDIIELVGELHILRVVHIDESITATGVASLGAVSILEKDRLITSLLIPHAKV